MPRAKEKAGKEEIFEGLGVAPGIAIGPAHVVESGRVSVPEYEIEPDAVDEELTRFRNAVAKGQKQLAKLRTKSEALPAAAREEVGFLLDAHRHMLTGSRILRGAEKRIAEQRINAEAAVLKEISKVAADFAALDDPYLAARAQDIREVGDRLIRNLTQTPYEAYAHAAEGSIVIAEELTPADTALMDPKRIAGIAAVLGGAESHTAIMARSLGLPAVLGATELIGRVQAGDLLVVDGDAGVVIVNPTTTTQRRYQRRREAGVRLERQLARLRRLPAVTRDGTTIRLAANLELPREFEQALLNGAEGVGLLRSEFMFMNRPDLPDEDEQYQGFRTIIEAMAGKMVTIRTLDLGADKLAASLTDRFGESANPALGLRAIRLSLREPALLDAQLAAILRASAHGLVRILLPMVSAASEVRAVRQAMMATVKRLKRRKVAFADPLPQLGVMIEVPGAALAADALAQVSEFFAIGTNDLTQYTLAIDRGDEQVAHLYNPLHPAVLRLIQFATEAALRARIPISVCGEIAGDPRYAPLLIGLGIRELSMTANSLPRVKQRIRQMDLLSAIRCAQVIMEQTDSGRITTLLDDFNSLA
ncbi:MAG: phosphoenolpyruvate--protein phosphotransferase [Rhodospirillaceae bacterium]|nr:phosphoenolpyruvate--protein phosphotransferase [Rhodospirillaceae bacterium]